MTTDRSDLVPTVVRRTSSGLGRRVALGAALMGTLAMGACGGSDTPGNSGQAGGPGDTVAGPGPEAPVTIAVEGKPRTGGSLTYAVEAETDGFAPTKNRWAISGTDIALNVFDPLAATDAEGKPQPYLAEKFESSADYKTWTITLRPGIEFHNGEKLNGEAVAGLYKAHKESGLTGLTITNVTSVEATGDLTVEFKMAEPWATFPSILTSQVGFIPAPAQLKMENGGPSDPIGTGPFKLASASDRIPDKSTKLTKNESYWRKDKDGTQLPYLDSVTFVPVTDNKQRVNGLESGEFQIIHTSDGPTILDIRTKATEGKIQKFEDEGESEEGFILLNQAKAPFDDIRARKALALAFDPQDYVNGPGNGVNRVANNVFSENSPWYTPVDYPKPDPAAAAQLVQEYEAEKGPLQFSLAGGGPDIKPNLEFLQQAFVAAGMEVDVKIVEQAAFIPTALTGDFQANLWRQWGEVDPDQDFLWWIGENALDIGKLALNMGRNKDPKVDAALRKARATTDVAERKEAYAEVQKQFAAQVPYIWLDHSTWLIAADNKVRGITNGELPDGSASIPIGGTSFPGTHRLVQTWLTA